MSACDLTLAIVSYQVRECLERCLTSVGPTAGLLDLQVIVVDNASADGSAEMVRATFPRVQLVVNPENRGFAAANNQALDLAQGRYWMLLNPDTEIPAAGVNPFQQLLAFMDGHPQAGACGPSLVYPDGTRQHSAFHFPTLAQVYIDLFPVPARLYDSGLNGRYPRALYDSGVPFRIDFALGAALLVRPRAVDTVGRLDEDYFIYSEEVDWCLRLQRAGWQVWCVPAARVIHHAARSTSQFREQMFVELWKARFTFYRKHYSRAFNAALRTLVRRGLAGKARRARRAAAASEIAADELSRRLTAYDRVRALADAPLGN